MASPSVPTITTLSTDALKDVGYSTPSTAQLTRAAEFAEQIKNDLIILAEGRKFKSLYTTSVLVTTNGQGRYANPTDYFSDLSVTALYGTKIGTAQTGAAGSVTLASGHGYTEAELIGKEVLIYEGTGIGSLSQTTGLSGDVNSVTPDFTTAPDNTSKYMFIEQYIKLKEGNYLNQGDRLTIPEKGEPVWFTPIGNVDSGEIIIAPVPYNTTAPYGLSMRYYANLMTADLTGTLMSTLYQRWRNLWITGIQAKQLFEDDDNRWQIKMREYGTHLQAVVMRETYGMNLSNLQCKVVDCA